MTVPFPQIGKGDGIEVIEIDEAIRATIHHPERDRTANLQADGTWSPDGNSIAFASGPSGSGPGALAIDIIDVKTHHISTVPDSQGFYSPRWSPDGRYLLAMPNTALSLRLYDFKLHKWSVLVSVAGGYPCWSRNSEYVYFLARQKELAISRVSIRDQKLEQVASLKGMQTTGYWGQWLGRAPDDSPLTLKDVGGRLSSAIPLISTGGEGETHPAPSAVFQVVLDLARARRIELLMTNRTL